MKIRMVIELEEYIELLELKLDNMNTEHWSVYDEKFEKEIKELEIKLKYLRSKRTL